MKKTVKFLLKWLLVVVASFAVAFVGAWTIGAYVIDHNEERYFSVVNDDGKTCTITGVMDGIGGDHKGLYIPDKISGKTVTAIAEEAFMNNEYIKNIRIPETVTYIGARAFKNCINASRVSIPGNVSFLGEGIFDGCANIIVITLQNGITVVPDDFAKGCKKLESIVIPNSVTEIGDSAFADCDTAVYVKLNANIEKIGTNAFAGCDKLLGLMYLSTEEAWQNVDVADRENIDSMVYYYSEQKPEAEGNYWYYGDDEAIKIWKYE